MKKLYLIKCDTAIDYYTHLVYSPNKPKIMNFESVVELPSNLYDFLDCIEFYNINISEIDGLSDFKIVPK